MLTHVKDYLYKTRWTIVLIAFISFLTHGSILFSQRFGIDTDIIIQGMHPFNKNGRPALMWISNLLEFEWFNLYLVQAFTILFMIAAPVSFGYLFYRIGAQTKSLNITLFVLAIAFIISPFWVAQIYFLNQCAQVLLAYTLTAISILLAEEARNNFRRKWYYLLVSILLMQFTFGSYQVLTVVYITAVAMCFLVYFFHKKSTLKKQLQWIGYHAGVFLIGFVIYMVTYKLFYSDLDGYLQDHINWAATGIVDGITYCLYAIRDSLQCHAPYYTGFYGIFVFFFLMITVLKLRKHQKGKLSTTILFFIIELFLVITPYIFIFIQGGQIPDRLQLILPLSQGCILYLTILALNSEKEETTKIFSTIYKVISILLILCICKDSLTNLNYCSRLYYTDQWIFEFDSKVAERIYADIQSAQSTHEEDIYYDNVVIVGYPQIEYNDICINGDMIGLSVYQFEKGIMEPDSKRIFFFMENLGYPVNVNFSGGELAAYQTYFVDCFGSTVEAMPSYPAEGYVQYVSNEELGLEYLVVKLGDDWRYTE